MRWVARPRPVVFACSGCERSRAAGEVAAALDRRGVAEAAVAGSGADKARARFPVHALDGCEERCALRWLREVGAAVERSFVVDAP